MVLNKYCNLVIFFTFSLNHKIFQKLPVPYVSRTQSPPPFPPRSLESRILNITDNQKCTVCEKLIKFWKWPVFYIFPLYTLWLDLDQHIGTCNEILGWIRIGIKLMQIKNTWGGGTRTGIKPHGVHMVSLQQICWPFPPILQKFENEFTIFLIWGVFPAKCEGKKY
jgi:hypothetical protein